MRQADAGNGLLGDNIGKINYLRTDVFCELIC
jgi:hypothetical protein